MAESIEELTQALHQSRNNYRALCFENRLLVARNAYFEKQIMENMKNVAEIRHLAFHDDLTGLPTRDLFLDRFNQEASLAYRHDQSLALIILDLDSFKSINDSMGHAAGDDLLKQLAKRIESALRATDTACRYDGDEFLILLSEIKNKVDARRVANEIGRILIQPYMLNSCRTCVGVSFGVAVYPCDGQSYDELFRCADSAMYRNKKAGHVTSFRSDSGDRHLKVVF